MSAAADIVLLGDIGATNARFALLADGVIGPILWREVARYPQFDDAIDEMLKSRARGAAIAGALLAVAGPIAGERVVMTNSSWVIDADALRARYGFRNVRIVNDFEATALSLPHLGEGDVHGVGGGVAAPGGTMAVLGPGSGLGVAALVSGEGRGIVIASEGGHASLAPESSRESVVVEHLRAQFGHVSTERVLSGPGIENLYRTLAALDGAETPLHHAAEITDAALKGSCRTARAALDMFCAMLGSFAGNVALMYGARGGVYIAGGIAPRIRDYIAASEFRHRFEAKGRFADYVKAIPSRIIVHPEATFLGLKALAAEQR